MRGALAALAIAALFLPCASGFQRRRPQGANATVNPEDKGLTPTFEGTLKMLTRKAITIQLQSDQLLEIRRDHKTKFVENGKEIKPSDIAVGTPLAIDVHEDIDLHPIAVRVVVNPPPPKADKASQDEH